MDAPRNAKRKAGGHYRKNQSVSERGHQMTDEAVKFLNALNSELEEQSNTPRDHVERLCKSGVIPAKKISPRLWGIPKENLQKFILS